MDHDSRQVGEQFGYSGFRRLNIVQGRIFAIFGIVVFTSIAAFIVSSAISAESSSFGNPPAQVQLIVIAVGLLMLVWSWCIGIENINRFPTIWVGKDTLWISAFLLFRVPVKWGDIIDITPRRHRSGSGMLVRARKITPFHYLTGFSYSLAWVPGFVIGYEIEDYDNLMSQIRTRAFNRKIIL